MDVLIRRVELGFVAVYVICCGDEYVGVVFVKVVKFREVCWFFVL